MKARCAGAASTSKILESKTFASSRQLSELNLSPDMLIKKRSGLVPAGSTTNGQVSRASKAVEYFYFTHKVSDKDNKHMVTGLKAHMPNKQVVIKQSNKDSKSPNTVT